MKKVGLILLIAVLLAGCSYPNKKYTVHAGGYVNNPNYFYELLDRLGVERIDGSQVGDGVRE